ncbi:WGR domain-containing protein [Ruegeria faecimaris]|nr:WGR domain-containing protein [Ruegeria faecimaris]
MELTATTPVHLIHVDPDINMARFYGIELQPTLFGEVSDVSQTFATTIGSQLPEVLSQTF